MPTAQRLFCVADAMPLAMARVLGVAAQHWRYGPGALAPTPDLLHGTAPSVAMLRKARAAASWGPCSP